MIFLKLQFGNELVEHSYADEAITLGRSPRCHVVLGERRVSRRHARIESVAGEVRLLDQDSGNGTFLNGLKIESHSLMVGDMIYIGSTLLTVLSLASTEGAAQGAPAPVSASEGETTVAVVEPQLRALRFPRRRRFSRLIRSS